MLWEARVAAHVAVADLSVKAGEPAHDIDLSTSPQNWGYPMDVWLWTMTFGGVGTS